MHDKIQYDMQTLQIHDFVRVTNGVASFNSSIYEIDRTKQLVKVSNQYPGGLVKDEWVDFSRIELLHKDPDNL